MTEDKARDRVDSADSARERNAVNRLREPAVARMGFFNGLLRARLLIIADLPYQGDAGIGVDESV